MSDSNIDIPKSTLGIPKSPYIFGIDLGTSNSAIAVYIKGKAETIPIGGKNILPSVVRVNRQGEMVVGENAKRYILIDPENVVSSVKQEMGQDWEKKFPRMPGIVYTPSSISACILSHLILNINQETIGIDLKGRPKYAVICIPANFNNAQKEATLAAAHYKDLPNSPDLEVIRLLEEPIAAAIAYGFDKKRDQTILVYDLGGGTFDVAVVKIDSQTNIQVLSKDGIRKLGGDDFDEEIVKIATQKFKEQNPNSPNILDEKKRQKLKEYSEKAKWELTEAPTAQINIPSFIKDESENEYFLDVEISRLEFNEAIKDLIAQSRLAVDRALTNAKLTITDIDSIILVGGSTKVPLVKEMLTEMFGKQPFSDADPQTVVARGAAIYGATLSIDERYLPSEDRPKEKIEINNILTHSLGIEITRGIFSCLLKKGTEIPQNQPLTTSQEYYTSHDNQTELKIRVYQTALDLEDDQRLYVRGTEESEKVEYIGEVSPPGIPRKPKGEVAVLVTFEVDQQNLLKVRVKIKDSDDEIELDIELK